MTIDLRQSDRGVLLPVQAQPKARKNALAGIHGGRLKVAVTRPPEKGKANEAIVKLLAAALGLKRSQVELVAGETSPRKTLLITGCALEDLRRKITAALDNR